MCIHQAGPCLFSWPLFSLLPLDRLPDDGLVLDPVGHCDLQLRIPLHRAKDGGLGVGVSAPGPGKCSVLYRKNPQNPMIEIQNVLVFLDLKHRIRISRSC